MARKTLKTLPPSQTLYKEHWKMLNSGGKMMEHVVDVKGDNLVRPAKLDEIVPGKQYYMQGIFKPTHFTPTVFDPAVSWDTIKELHNTGRIWLREEDQQG